MNHQYEPDLTQICRTCLYKAEPDHEVDKDRTLLSIYEFLPPPVECESTQQIVELLINIAPQLHIPKMVESMPQMICGRCLEQLRQAHQFQQMCLSADSHMQQLQLDYGAVEMKSIFSTVAQEEKEAVLVVADPLESTNYLKLELGEGEVMQEFIANVEVKTEANLNDNLHLETHVKPIVVENSSDETVEKLACRQSKRIQKQNKSSSPLKIKDEDELETALSSSSSSCGSDKDYGEELKIIKSPNKKLFSNAINPEGYKCDECPRRFAKQESLRTHKGTTHDPNQYECDLCGKKFKLKRSLAKHRRRTHAESTEQQKQKQREDKEAIAALKAMTDAPKLHVCKFCNKAFNQACTLKDHLRIHTGEKPYLCSECGKGFNSSSNMKQHLLRHTGEKRYECPDCPKKFPCLSDLASHKAVHRKLKSHICDICGNAFGKPFQLKKHKMYHNGEKPHKCEYCEMRFVCADHMRRHMRTHTGEKPYKCKYCPRAFAQSNDLIKHLRSHLGENVYRCELCPCGFRLATELREHFAEHKTDDDATRLTNLQRLVEEEAKLIIKIGGGGRGSSSCKNEPLAITH